MILKGNLQKKKYNNWICVIVVTLGLLVVFGLGMYTTDFLFRSNDDIFIRAILSGSITGEPDAHAIYILYPLSWLLSVMYRLIPSVEWYSLFILGLHFLCWGIVIYRSVILADTRLKQIRSFISSAFLIFLLDFSWLTLSQYTALAGLVFCTAIYYFMTIKKDVTWKKYIPVILLVILAFLIRYMVVLMCIPFLLCYMLYELSFLKENKLKEELTKKIKTYIYVSGVLLLLFGLMYGVNSLAYQSEDWKAYKAYNTSRTEVYDYYSFPNYIEQTDFYDSLGIKEEEMYLIQSANTALDENISLNEMYAIAEKSKELHKEYEQYYSVPRKVVFDYLDSLKNVNMEEILIYILYGALIVLILKYKTSSLMIGFSSVIFIRSIIRSYLIYRGRFPDRVSYPLALAEMIVLIGLIIHAVKYHNYDWQTNNKNRVYYVWGLFICIIMFVFGLDTYKTALDLNKEIKTSILYSDNMFSYFERYPENNYVLEVQSIAAMKAPLFGTGNEVPDNAIYLGGWLEGSPLIEIQYERQLGCGVSEAVLIKDNTFFVQRSDLSTEWLVSFYESQGMSIEANVVDHIMINGMEAYAIISLTDK